MALYHKQSNVLFPTDVGDSDITNNVALYFEIAKVMAELSKTKDPAKYILETTAAVIKRNYFLQLKVADIASQNQLLKTIAPVVLGEPLDQEATTSNTTCVCQQYNLIWGAKVSCEFRKKVVEISKRQNFDPNDFMAVMAVETSETFSPSKIKLKKYTNAKGKKRQDYFGLTKEEIMNLPENFDGAVGLIQFTPAAIKDLNTYYKYNLTKRKLALMTQLEQLDYAENYIAMWKKVNKINGKLTLGDLYLLVFAPSKMNGSDDNTILYKKGTKEYEANESLDKDNNGITKKELATRAYEKYKIGETHKEDKFSCGIVSKSEKQLSNQEDGKWHDPVDNPMLCLYTQNGNYRPRYNVFGKVRKERASSNHQGMDLLALPKAKVYACVNAYIEFIEVESGYGNVICLKVKDTASFLKRKRDFKLVYENEGEILQGKGFNFDGNIYLFYAHLDSFSISMDDKEVTCGQAIGLTGTSGYGSTKDPHLHFEIRNASRASGLNNRCHPGYFVYYKNEADMTQAEKDYHKKIAEKYWD